ncbi:ribonuclease HI [Clostridium sp. 'deep sea']|uniref:ribonuclease H family protein n=1 Tax=Clostridium sp. 'deep sea' TaxID=2779445 RepID=UPI00189655B9|nr:ribonuclease H [Clostridium sp. 'deep sea']QOR36263.1 ribonuclease HI [Clostridium sp. 'deep sea']
MNKIEAYCDGGCRNNQANSNVGGWGVLLQYQGHVKELRGGAVNTTNNIMELTSCIKALEAIKKKSIPVSIFSDSAYVVNAFKQGWITNWKKNGWINSKKEPVKNKEYWFKLLELIEKFERVEFIKVKGHSTNVGNNRADELANIAMDEVLTNNN